MLGPSPAAFALLRASQDQTWAGGGGVSMGRHHSTFRPRAALGAGCRLCCARSCAGRALCRRFVGNQSLNSFAGLGGRAFFLMPRKHRSNPRALMTGVGSGHRCAVPSSSPIANSGVSMNRRSFGLAAMYAGALFVGTVAGGAASVPSVYAKAAPSASPQPSSASQSPAQAPVRKAPPIQCKTTKECPQDNVCTKVGDHKECTRTQLKVPTTPVVT